MKITAINKIFVNSKKTNNSFTAVPNTDRTNSSVNFAGADKFVRNASEGTDKLYTIIKAKFERVMLPLKGNEQEQGLNRIVGLNGLKAGLYQDVLMPLMDVMDGKPKHYLVPNGIYFFGPRGVGKTFIAEQLGEHYALKGGYYENLIGKFPWNIEKDNHSLEKAFSDAETRFINSGKKKYTMFFLDAIDCYFGKNKDRNLPCKNKFIELTKNCRDKGIILLTDSDSIERMEPILLKNGRTDLRIPLNYVANEDITEFIQHYIKHDSLYVEGIIDYESIVSAIKQKGLKFKPKEIEWNLLKASDNAYDYDVKVGTSEIKDILTNRFNDSFVNDEIKQLERDKNFANKLGGVYEY